MLVCYIITSRTKNLMEEQNCFDLNFGLNSGRSLHTLILSNVGKAYSTFDNKGLKTSDVSTAMTIN